MAKDLLKATTPVNFKHPISTAESIVEKHMGSLGFSPLGRQEIAWGIKRIYTNGFIQFETILYFNKKKLSSRLVFDKGSPESVMISFKNGAYATSIPTPKEDSE